jgi:4-hydroxy-tetrahydrodipicolinate synthase
MIPGFMTPFKEDYSLDEERFKEHLKFVINIRHVGGVAITAGAGEHFALEFEEFKRCQELAVEVAKGKVHIWTNLGAESMLKTMRLADAARDAGVDGLRIISANETEYEAISGGYHDATGRHR